MFHAMLEKILIENKHVHRVSWKHVCENPLIDYSFLEARQEKWPLFKKFLHLHPDYPPERILNQKKTDWIYFSRTVSIDFIVETMEDSRYHWVFYGICQNLELTPEILAEHFLPFLSYDMMSFLLKNSMCFCHPGFGFEVLQNYPYMLKNLHMLSSHPSFTKEWLFRIPKRRWNELDWKALSKHPGIPLSFIEKTFSSLPWSIPDMSFHPHLTLRFVTRYMKKQWNWDAISENMHISEAWIYRNTIPIRYAFLSKNLHLRLWFVHERLFHKWDRIQLAMNPALRPKDVFHDPILFPLWRWDHVLRNPSLDMETLEKMRIQFHVQIHLFRNHFHVDKKYQRLQRFRIQHFFWNLARRRLLKKKIMFLKRVYQRLHADVWFFILSFI